ncbi:MAG: hypothetical protein GX352_06015 [Clostridiales bacterium]|nr:hypothetical protein [Clostridiales bacterium]
MGSRPGCLSILAIIALVIITVILLVGCVPGDGRNTSEKPAGFLWGIWHGWMAPISLIIGLFDNKIRVYEALNKGWIYDFGFYMAIISGFGGLSLIRKKRKRK